MLGKSGAFFAAVVALVVSVCLLAGVISGSPAARQAASLSPRPPGAAGDRLAAVPPAARSAVVAALGRADRRFFAHRAPAGYAIRDSRAGLSATFTPGAVVVHAAATAWSLGLRAVQRGTHVTTLQPVSPVALANVVRYASQGVQQWYADGPLGLEQGFTLTARPAGPAARPLMLVLGALPRGLRPVGPPDPRSISLGHAGRVLLRYTGLLATDAGGRSLPASIEVRDRQLSLRVDDHGARYPLRVDPFVQAGKLSASDGAAGDVFGSAVAISGDTIVVGAPVPGATPGAAYVFVKPANGWANATETAKLTPSDGANGDQFGTSVAISGDTIVVGAPDRSINQGAAYVFVKPVNGWAPGTETTKLTASDGTSDNWFGSSVAISGDTIVAGAYGATVAGHQFQGAAYVFVKPAGGWGSATPTQAKLTATDGAASDHLGQSVGISGDTIVAGAPIAAIGGRANQGAAYVFVKPANGWVDGTQSAKLTASDGAALDTLGLSVGVSGDTAVAGAPNATISANQGQGAAYVFVKPTNGWADGTETAKLTASDGAAGDQLGGSVAASGDLVVAGAKANSFRGAAYVFTKPAGGWGSGTATQQKLTGSDESPGDEFGYGVGIDTTTVIVGAADATVSNNANQGAAYVFDTNGGGGGGGGGPKPVNTDLPQITDTTGGVLRLGHVLSSSPGTWLNAPTAYRYQWQRCDAGGANCQPISSAAAQTYTVTAADIGFTIRIHVTASNGGGSADATSAPTAVVTRELVLSPDRLDFGAIAPAEASTPQAVTVTNAGSGALRITAVNVPDPNSRFTITADHCFGVTLQPGGSCTVAVAFIAPDVAGPQAYSGTLAIYDDQERIAANVALTGAIPAGAAAIPPGTIFGQVLTAAGGRPVAGAWMFIRSLVGGVTDNLYAAADGSYASTSLPAGLYQVEVYPTATFEGTSALVRVGGGPVQQNFYLHAPVPLSGGVTFDTTTGASTSGVPTITRDTPFSLHIPVHIPTGAPNSVHVYAILGGVGPDSGSTSGGGDVAGAVVFSVFYNAQGWPTRMSRILVGALDCGALGSANPCGRLAAIGVGPGARAAADKTPAATPHPGCDVNGNWVPDKYYDGHFHMIPNDKGGIDFVIPLADGSPERVGFLWQAQLPVPSPSGNPLQDTGLALAFGAVNGAINGALPAIGYYNAAVGALNGIAQLGDNPDPIEGGAQGVNAAETVLITLLNAETHGGYYWVANILAGDVNAVLPQSPSTQPPPNPCNPPPPSGGSPGSGPGGGGGGGSFGNFYIDPSGVVETRSGIPIAGATVTLMRAGTRRGRQLRVPGGSRIMAPGNRRNPDQTGLMGNFGWDVLPGFYQVTAKRRGCTGAAHTRVLAIPPPFTNLLLRLNCPAPRRTATRLKLRARSEGPNTTVLRATIVKPGPRRQLTGTVTFRIGRSILTAAPLDLKTGTAVLDVPRLKLHGRFNAAYSGNALFAPSSATAR